MIVDNRRLLILGCSQRKRCDLGELPALERYDGPAFRLLRRFFAQCPTHSLDVYILSARFGLIPGNKPIPNYDQKMTKARSQQLQPRVHQTLYNIVQTSHYDCLLFCLSKDYLQILNNYDKTQFEGLNFTIATGTVGRKLSILHTWLHGQTPTYLHKPSKNSPSGKAILNGTEFSFTPEQVINIARQALAAKKGKPYNYQTWYVVVDEQRVSPKWLVSQLTGFPVSAFHSIRARQMLQQLGINIYSEL